MPLVRLPLLDIVYALFKELVTIKVTQKKYFVLALKGYQPIFILRSH